MSGLRRNHRCFSFAKSAFLFLLVLTLGSCANIRLVKIMPKNGATNASFYLVPQGAWEKYDIENKLDQPEALQDFTLTPAPATVRRPEGRYILVTVCDGVIQADSWRPIFIGVTNSVHSVTC